MYNFFNYINQTKVRCADTEAWTSQLMVWFGILVPFHIRPELTQRVKNGRERVWGGVKEKERWPSEAVNGQPSLLHACCWARWKLEEGRVREGGGEEVARGLQRIGEATTLPSRMVKARGGTLSSWLKQELKPFLSFFFFLQIIEWSRNTFANFNRKSPPKKKKWKTSEVDNHYINYKKREIGDAAPVSIRRVERLL